MSYTAGPQVENEHGMDQDGLLARCQALIAAADLDELAKLTPDLEAVMPATEAAWAVLFEVFTKLERRVWLEIVTRRFVAVQPDNLAARLEEARLVSEASTRREEALELADKIRRMDVRAAEDFLRLGVIYSNCFAVGPASEYLARAVAGDPDNMFIRHRMIYAFLALGDKAQAREELVKMQAISHGNVERLISVAAVALSMQQIPIANEALEAAIIAVEPTHHVHRASLIILASRLERHAEAVRLAAATDFSNAGGVAMLDAVYVAIEGRGLHDTERQITAAALSLEPGNLQFRERARVQSLPFTSLFPSTGAGAAGSRPRMITRTVMDRVRELMFWR
jgi:hypothetical protein